MGKLLYSPCRVGKHTRSMGYASTLTHPTQEAFWLRSNETKWRAIINIASLKRLEIWLMLSGRQLVTTI